MIIQGIVIVKSHTLRLKSGPAFAVRVINKTGVHHVLFQNEQCSEYKALLHVQHLYEFSGLKQAEIKGIPIFVASETTCITLSSQDIDFLLQLKLSFIGNTHGSQLQELPEDCISYEGKVTKVIVPGCLYELDEGKVILCTAHLSLAAMDLPFLEPEQDVFVTAAHHFKSIKPIHLVCCGLSTVMSHSGPEKCVYQGSWKMPDYVQLVNKLEWNFLTFKKMVAIVQALKSALCPTFLRENQVQSIFLMKDYRRIIEVLGYTTTEMCSEVEKENGNSPLRDFLSLPHTCCAVREHLQFGRFCDRRIVPVAELLFLHESTESLDFGTWKLRSVPQKSFPNEEVVLGCLDTLDDGMPCLKDKTATIPIVISHRWKQPNSVPTLLNEGYDMPFCGDLVIFSKFSLVCEVSHIMDRSDTYAIVREEDLIHIKVPKETVNNSAEKLPNSRSFFIRDESADAFTSFLSMVVLMCGRSPTSRLSSQCTVDVLVITNCVVEVLCPTVAPDSAPADFFLPTPLSNRTSAQELEEYRRKRFILDDPSLVKMSSYLVIGRPYLVQMPVTDELLSVLRLSKAPSLRLTHGACIKPFAPSVHVLCPKHGPANNQYLSKENCKFVLLTKDCICLLANPRAISLSVLSQMSDYNDETISVQCKVKGKEILLNNNERKLDDGPFTIHLLVSDLYNTGPGPPKTVSIYLNPCTLWSGSGLGLIPDRPILLTCLKRVRSHLGRLYLRATRDTVVQHLYLNDTLRCMSEAESMISLIRLNDITQVHGMFQLLATVLKIFSISFSNVDGDHNTSSCPVNIEATFLVDDGNCQSIMKSTGETIQQLLALNDSQWNMILYLASNSADSLSFKTGRAQPLQEADRLLMKLCARDQLRRQVLLTCQPANTTYIDRSGRQHFFCCRIQEVGAMDVCLLLLHHLETPKEVQ